MSGDDAFDAFEEGELDDDSLAELASGELRRVRSPDGRFWLMTEDEIRACIEHAAGDEADE